MTAHDQSGRRVILNKDNPDGILDLPDGRCRVILRHEVLEGVPSCHSRESPLDDVKVRSDRSRSPYVRERQLGKAKGELRTLLVTCLSDGEIKNLCQDLGVDYEMFPREKGGLTREFLEYLDRRDRLCEVLERLEKQRLDVFEKIPLEVVKLLKKPLPSPFGPGI